MLLRIFAKPLMFFILGGACLSLSPGYDNSRSPNRPSVHGVKPGISDDSQQNQRPDDRGGSREEIAQADIDPPYPQSGNFRMGDWDFRENWRYNRDAFYSGQSQPEAYRDEHPYGPQGIGYDADVNYARNLKRYREIYQKNPTPENKERLEHYINPYHAGHYEGNYGEGSYNDAYGKRNSGRQYDQNNNQQRGYRGLHNNQRQ